MLTNRTAAYNFSYPSSAGSVVFGVHLSARAPDSYRDFRLDLALGETIRPCV